MDIIRVNREFLLGVAADLDDLAAEISHISAIRGSLSSAPKVDSAHREFEGRWDERREELGEELNVLAVSVRNVMASFEEADSTQAEQLQEFAR